MNKNTLVRIKEYLDFKGISIHHFEKSINISNGSFASQLKNNKTIGVDRLENILIKYPDINPEWLLTGRGAMLHPQTSIPITPSMVSTTFTSNDCEQTHLENQRLNEDIKFHKKTIENLQSVVTNLQASNASLQVQNERYQTKIDTLQQKIEALEQPLMTEQIAKTQELLKNNTIGNKNFKTTIPPPLDVQGVKPGNNGRIK